jgi:hypothetical protein
MLSLLQILNYIQLFLNSFIFDPVEIDKLRGSLIL